jgi:hypothetical protein
LSVLTAGLTKIRYVILEGSLQLLDRVNWDPSIFVDNSKVACGMTKSNEIAATLQEKIYP